MCSSDLGDVAVASALWKAGARSFFVADIEAGVRVKAALPQSRTLVLHGVPAGTETELTERGLIPVLSSLCEIERWGGHARRLGHKLPAFIHIDTGMNRLGLPPGELDRLCNDQVTLLEGLDMQAWMSHLACADDPVNPLTAEQLRRVHAALARLPKAPVSLSNSAGIFHGADYHFDLVRPGIALYGANPAPWLPNPMRPVIRLLARILQIRDVAPPDTVGYDATHRITRPGKVAALGMGYADGYPRARTNKGQVLVRGGRAQVSGTVCMDWLMLDVTHIPGVAVGDDVTLIGEDRKGNTVFAEEVAHWAGTIPYELLCGISKRVPRVYLGAGK